MDLLKIREKFECNAVGRATLSALAGLYGAGVWFNQFLHDNGWKKSERVNTRVVCVGNITSGGTGKTTAVLLAARTLAEAGVRVAIISRGYKRAVKTPDPVVLYDDELENTWQSAGDEPFMMSRALADVKVPVVVHENRYLAATEALKRFKSQILLLDDGFQHYKLQRDANIVLIDARSPFGGGRLIPRGLLREPVAGLKKANLILVTHSDQVSKRELENIKDQIRLINDEVEILSSVHKPEHFFDAALSRTLPLNALTGDVAVFSALGAPESFEQTVKDLGLNIVKKWRYADHSVYTEADLRSFVEIAAGTPLITTFKDFIKFPPNWREIFIKDVYLLSVSMALPAKKDMAIFAETLYPGFKKVKK